MYIALCIPSKIPSLFGRSGGRRQRTIKQVSGAAKYPPELLLLLHRIRRNLACWIAQIQTYATMALATSDCSPIGIYNRKKSPTEPQLKPLPYRQQLHHFYSLGPGEESPRPYPIIAMIKSTSAIQFYKDWQEQHLCSIQFATMKLSTAIKCTMPPHQPTWNSARSKKYNIQSQNDQKYTRSSFRQSPRQKEQ